MPNHTKYHQANAFMESLMNMLQVDFFKGGNDPDFYFQRAQHLLKTCNLPNKKLKIILVGGTSGKGTTANMLHQVLSLSGQKTGLYLSPHTTTAIERIKINDQLISPADFAGLVDQLKPKWEKASQAKWGAPSYFEVFLSLALEYFKQQKCDYAVLEIGCGGFHDAANAVPDVEFSLLTNVGLDHTQILGDTVEKIAAEKIGIARPERILFTGARQASVKKIFIKHCKKYQCRLDFISSNKPNQALVRAAAEHLKIESAIIDQGIAQAKLPCRLEIMQTSPLVIIDGAHNPDKIKYLTKKLITPDNAYLEKFKLSKGKMHLVIGLTAGKNPLQVFKTLLPLADSITCTRFCMPYRKVFAPYDLAKALQKKFKKNIKSFIDPQAALQQALSKAQKNDLILVVGSFYLGGELRTNWIKEQAILENQDSQINNFQTQ